MKEQLRILWLSILLVTSSLPINAQLVIEDIKTISITDRVNWNYESISSFVWEIKFNDFPELWHTKQISRAEFESKINKTKVDSLNLLFQEYRKLGRDSLKKYMTERNFLLEIDYNLYCDTVSPVFIRYVDVQEIINLSNALLDTTYNYEKFKNELEPADSVIEDLEIFMTSYYPFIGVTIVLNSGDSLIAYCDGQGSLTIPWILKHFNFKSFNPVINRSLYAILPEEMNLNRKRLKTGLSKK
jgi:hypothetical protein